MRRIPLGIALAVAALSLAGCAKEPPAESETPEAFQGITEDVAVTGTRGAIAGVVVDEAIRPIVGANVTLVSLERIVATDEQGRFSFEGLDAGTYFIAAEARRHESTQVSADVVAGAPTVVRILLVASTGVEPYHVTLHFRGHIENYLGYGNFVVEVIAPGTLGCTCTLDTPVDANLTTVLVEATGQVAVPNPGTPATVPGDAYWEVMNGSAASGALQDSGYDEFPLSLRFSAEETFPDADIIGVRITCGIWPCVTMDYDLFVTLWYHEEAPEDWTIFEGDT